MSIVSIGVDNGKRGYDGKRIGGFESICGDSSVKLNGRTYNYFEKSSKKGNAINYFLFDAFQEMEEKLNELNKKTLSYKNNENFENLKVNNSYMRRIFEELKISNKYCSELVLIGNKIRNCGNSCTEISKVLKSNINTKTHHFEIGAILNDNSEGSIVYQYSLCNQQHTLQSTSPNVEPLVFPLLFPYGEDGWTNKIQKYIGCLLYICSRWLIPESINAEEVLNNNNIIIITESNEADVIKSILVQSGTKLIVNTDKKVFVKKITESRYIICMINNTLKKFLPASRFQIMSRIAQYHMVDLYSRSQDYKLNWHKNNTHLIFGKYENYVDDPKISENNNPSSKNNKERVEFSNSNPSFLAASFHGSPRHLKNLALAALTVVSEYGGPTIFFTATVNPYWKEIQEMLLYGQSAYDRPDVVCRVFHRKVDLLMKNLRKGKYFGSSKVIYLMRVYEYQYRGFPHAHIVVRLSNSPNNKSDKEEVVNWIDEFICAELPKQETENTLYNIVVDNMVHSCSKDVNGCLDENGNCYRNYDKKVISEVTCIDSNGYPQYRRRHKNDLKIVPYNKKMLLDWNGHLNVEFCASNFAVLYLYKYLFKGVKKVRVDFDNTSDLNEKDEINQYLRGRIITSMDVMWRAFGFQTYPATSPFVRLVCCKLPMHIEILLKECKACDLLIYFRRPLCLNGLKFTEFYNIYDYDFKLPKTYSRHLNEYHKLNESNLTNDSDIDDVSSESGIEEEQSSQSQHYYNITNKCSDIVGNDKNREIFIYKRVRQYTSITRMQHINILMGEIYYLRTILSHVPVTSFDDILTVNGNIYETFQEAAIERNLINESTEALNCFYESMVVSTPEELRNLFVMLTVNGHQTLCIFNNAEARRAMCDDLKDAIFENNEFSFNKLLKILQLKFKISDKSLDTYGLPSPENMDTELQREKMKYCKEKEKKLFEELNKNTPNNSDQENALNVVYNLLNKNKGGLIFLQGPAGSGKSTCAKKAISYCRSLGKIALGCASTALAAKVYDDFDTTHSLFKYPVIENMEDIEDINDIQLTMDEYPERKELIENASLVVWDEAPSNEVNIFRTVYIHFNSFPTTVLFLIGDWRQCPPVVQNGSMLDICKVSLLNSNVWHMFEIYKLSQNMRVSSMNTNNINCEHCESHCNCEYNQTEYAKMILSIGNGETNNISVLEYETPLSEGKDHPLKNYNDGSINIRLPTLKYITDSEEAINFIFPDLFNENNNNNNAINNDNNSSSSENKIKTNSSAILCATNKYVDEWNTKIQSLNKNKSHTLLSNDKFDFVDDTKDILKSMINEDILNKYNDVSVPPHTLILKEDDICFIMRNLLKKDGLTNNTRVKILKIQKYSIKVCTIDTRVPKVFTVPRIYFKVSLPYGRGFTMIRKQFPLRLAYSMTYNKSQGQELHKCLVDIRSPPFVHGHLYVALSRVKYYNNIRIFCTEDNIVDGAVVLKNYFYQLLQI